MYWQVIKVNNTDCTTALRNLVNVWVNCQVEKNWEVPEGHIISLKHK